MTDKTVLPTLLIGACLLPMWGVLPATAFLYSHPQYKTTVARSVAVLSSLNLASQKGILIKDGRTLELLNQIDTVVFDKTGTLTKEQPQVAAIHRPKGFHTSHGASQAEVLRLAAAAEYKQSHPIAKAILEEASSYQLELPNISESEYKVGYGISVTLNEQVIRVGSARFMEMEELTMTPEMRQIEARCHRDGHTLVLVGRDNQVVGGIELHATVRPEAQAVIRGLRERGMKELYIISGDHEGPTKKLAQELGIDHYFAETLPEQKADLIDQLQQEGKSVCYIGDGINDSIALTAPRVPLGEKNPKSPSRCVEPLASPQTPLKSF